MLRARRHSQARTATLLGRGRNRILLVLTLKAVNPTFGVDELLLACIKWMAGIAHVDLNLLDGGKGRKDAATTDAGNRSFKNFWVNFFFHTYATLRAIERRMISQL